MPDSPSVIHHNTDTADDVEQPVGLQNAGFLNS